MTDDASTATHRRHQAATAIRALPPIPEADGTDRARFFFEVLHHRLPCRPTPTARTSHPKAS